MGIPGFSTWLRARYPEAFEDPKERGKSHDAVYIDLASTLHTVTRKAYSKSAFHVLLHRRLDELIDSLGPTKRVVIAMDGPAPLAKLLEQRRRRKKEADKTMDGDGSDLSDDEYGDAPKGKRGAAKGRKTSGYVANNRRDPRTKGVSSLFLTTGTLFMLEVHNSLLCYIMKRLQDPKYQHLEYEFSDSTVKGEGELKIVSRLLQHGANDADSHAVVGADSDLLLMTMIASRPNVFVVDDLPRRKNKNGVKQKKPKVFKADALARIWKSSLLDSDPVVVDGDVSSLARDLTLLAILSSGNDYLPGCQGLTLKDNTRPGLWNLYLDMRRQAEWRGQSLTVLEKIPGMGGMEEMESRADLEGGGEAGVANEPPRDPHLRRDTLPLPDFRVRVNGPMVAALLVRNIEQKYAPVHNEKKVAFGGIAGNWDFGMKLVDRKKIRATQMAASTPQILMRKPADCAGYVKGLEWTLTMYSTGGVEDYRYSYPAAPPMLMNLVQHLECLPTPVPSDVGERDRDEIGDRQIISRSIEKSFMEKAALQPLLPAACALALLPARSRDQAASALRHLMDADSPVAEIYAVCKECQRLAKSIRAANAELEEVRKELATVQDKLSSVGLDSESALEVDKDLEVALEKWEAAGEPLRDMLRELSRSHHKHVMEAHPYKAFPTEDLEEAVLNVPVSKYPFWERQLTRFGREIVLKKVDPEGPLSVLKQQEAHGGHESKWVKECIRFANAYPKVAKADTIVEGAKQVGRLIVPLHPYMQPGGSIRLPPRRPFHSTPTMTPISQPNPFLPRVFLRSIPLLRRIA
jgi:hypothetical protein